MINREDVPDQVMCHCTCDDCVIARFMGLEKEKHCNIPGNRCRVDR